MNMLCDIFDYFYNLFYNWNTIDFIIVIGLIIVMARWLYLARREHKQANHKHYTTSRQVGAHSGYDRELNIPPMLRDKH